MVIPLHGRLVSCTTEEYKRLIESNLIEVPIVQSSNINIAEKFKEELNATKKLNDWNDVSTTKIPLNVEIFALIQDRMDSEKLRPEVIIARMMPAKRLTWTENKEGDVLCYDVSAGNYHSCNGNYIKYWKYVNVPSEHEKFKEK